jgi:hypothetical protein
MTTQYRWGRASLALRIAAAAIVVINLLDAAFTLVWTLSGLATEANPLMDVELAYGPMRFMVTKLALVSLGLLLLWRLRSVPLARVAILGSAAAYVVLLTYHLNEVPQLFALLG